MDLKETVTALVDAGYVSIIKGKPVFTDKARTELGILVPTLPAVVQTQITDLVPGAKTEDQMTIFMQFIEYCKIPAKAYDTMGRPYFVNRATKEGCKEFFKILSEGIDLKVLAVSVAAYYKSTMGFKKILNNYLTDGSWRMDYEETLRAIKDGTIREHVKQQVDGPASRITRG